MTDKIHEAVEAALRDKLITGKTRKPGEMLEIIKRRTGDDFSDVTEKDCNARDETIQLVVNPPMMEKWIEENWLKWLENHRKQMKKHEQARK